MLKTFDEICTFPVVYDAYLAARRGKRSKAATAKYEAHALENVSNLVYILRTQLYRPGPFHLFTVYEPKERLVQAPAFTDKVCATRPCGQRGVRTADAELYFGQLRIADRQRAALRA